MPIPPVTIEDLLSLARATYRGHDPAGIMRTVGNGPGSYIAALAHPLAVAGARNAPLFSLSDPECLRAWARAAEAIAAEIERRAIAAQVAA